jgi:hypothetical protein
MKLSQRLWWSVAHNTNPDDAVECMVWGKVRTQCQGKRHYLREIELTQDEEEAVIRILRNPPDDYMRSQIAHEATNFPDGRERSKAWLPELRERGKQGIPDDLVPGPPDPRALTTHIQRLEMLHEELGRLIGTLEELDEVLNAV